MIGFYALGGGFGHVTRIKSFIEAKGIIQPFKVIANSPRVLDLFHEDQVVFLDNPNGYNKEALQQELEEILSANKFADVYIDVFPNGILGELKPEMFANCNVHLLARRLLWNTYAPYLSSMQLNTVFQVEPLEDAHQAWLINHSDGIEQVSFSYPETERPPEALSKMKAPVWLVVHSSNTEETELLIQHAQEIANLECAKAQFVVLTNQPIQPSHNASVLHGENPLQWFPFVDRIVTAAGFNTWNATAAHRQKHICLPFPRRFDDQFWRANRLSV